MTMKKPDRLQILAQFRNVRSKLKCPLFVASEMSGFKLTSSGRGCGKVEIPRRLRDFQAGWESRVYDFSTSRLFHSPSRRHLCRALHCPCGRVASQQVRPVSKAESSIQVLMHCDLAARQCGSPAHGFDL